MVSSSRHAAHPAHTYWTHNHRLFPGCNNVELASALLGNDGRPEERVSGVLWCSGGMTSGAIGRGCGNSSTEGHHVHSCPQLLVSIQHLRAVTPLPELTAWNYSKVLPLRQLRPTTPSRLEHSTLPAYRTLLILSNSLATGTPEGA